MDPSWEETAEMLTQQALLSAEEGRWDAVERHYRDRVDLVRSRDISASLAHRLHTIDSRVHEKLRIATIAAQCVLTEVTLKRRLLERFSSESDVSLDRSRVVSRRV
jgi:hypothetical protein